MRRILALAVAIGVALPLPLFAQQLSASNPAPAPGSGSVLSPAEEHLWKGDMLYLEGDYYRAITEYKYFLLEATQDPRRDEVKLKIAWIYDAASKPDAARKILRRLAKTHAEEPLGWWARLYLAHSAMRAEEPLQARRLYEGLLKDCEPYLAKAGESQEAAVGQCLQIATYARFGLARYYNRLHEFDEAAEQLEQIPEQAPQSADARKVAAYVATLDIPSKSPTLAGVLSVVPGLGHFYIEEYTVGIVAMIWNGAFIYATVDAIIDENVGQAVLLGLLELVWYAGTIFGAVAGANRFNRDAKVIVEEGLTRDISNLDADVPWPARFPAEYPVGLQLKFEF